MASSVRFLGVAAGALSAMLGGSGAFAAQNISADFGISHNSHFVTYGLDVWSGGSRFFGSRATSWIYGDLAFKANDWLTFNLAVWTDNNNNTRSAIGGHLQEVDINPGFTINYGKLATSFTYNIWSYAGDVEESADIGFAYDDTDLLFPGFALRPKILWHYRTAGNGAQTIGSAVVMSISPGWNLTEALSLSVPAGLAMFTTSDFQGGWEGGYGFSYVGANLNYALNTIPEEYGKWSLYGGVTAYFTKPEAIPYNTAASFLTGTVGVVVAY